TLYHVERRQNTIKQKLAKERRESETQRMRTTMTTTTTTIKSKTENESFPSYPYSPTNPNVRPPTTRTAFVIHVNPPALSSFYGTRLYRMGGPSGAADPFFSPHHGTESHQTPSTSPTPRTLGLVSSFGSVLLIFSAVQPASHDF
uniref:Uncharacterized protein n=1 Tax=Sander lucioperca TaxID=283035 RepID=A0A8D0CPR5_SANLU